MASSRPKSWNRINHQNSSSFQNSLMNFNNYSSSNLPGFISQGGGGNTAGGGGDPFGGAPPLPPRPTNVPQPNRVPPLYRNSSTLNSYSLYGTPNYNSSSYMPYYPGMGLTYGYNSYGSSSPSSGGNYNSLYHQVEDSSRQAFQSIESIVQAFTSVSMMLDSTFQALYSSFRAVVGVADNLSRLKSQICRMMSALAVIRTLRYLVRKVLEILRLSPAGGADSAWDEAVGHLVSQDAFNAKSGNQFSSWPILMFFGIIIGAPWLIWKLISPTGVPKWVSGEEDHYLSESLYSFQGENQDELSFNVGQKIIIAPREIQPRIKGWLLASVDGKKVGIVPANYLKEPILVSGRQSLSPDQQQQQQQKNSSKAPPPPPPQQCATSALASNPVTIPSNAQTNTQEEEEKVFNSYFKSTTDT